MHESPLHWQLDYRLLRAEPCAHRPKEGAKGRVGACDGLCCGTKGLVSPTGDLPGARTQHLPARDVVVRCQAFILPRRKIRNRPTAIILDEGHMVGAKEVRDLFSLLDRSGVHRNHMPTKACLLQVEPASIPVI